MMKCPQCNAQNTIRLRELTTLGYRRFQCKNCRTRFNERSGSPFNFLEYPTDLVSTKPFLGKAIVPPYLSQK